MGPKLETLEGRHALLAAVAVLILLRALAPWWPSDEVDDCSDSLETAEEILSCAYMTLMLILFEVHAGCLRNATSRPAIPSWEPEQDVTDEDFVELCPIEERSVDEIATSPYQRSTRTTWWV